jgi:hypothetical protein
MKIHLFFCFNLFGHIHRVHVVSFHKLNFFIKIKFNLESHLAYIIFIRKRFLLFNKIKHHVIDELSKFNIVYLFLLNLQELCF